MNFQLFSPLFTISNAPHFGTYATYTTLLPQLKIYYTDPNDEDDEDTTEEKDAGLETLITFNPESMPCWVAVAARTDEGTGPFSNFKKVSSLSPFFLRI